MNKVFCLTLIRGTRLINLIIENIGLCKKSTHENNKRQNEINFSLTFQIFLLSVISLEASYFTTTEQENLVIKYTFRNIPQLEAKSSIILSELVPEIPEIKFARI